jgi:uncharacterized protein YjbJ (UPF0337 family)
MPHHDDEKLQAEGKMDEVKGRAREAWGGVTGDTGDEVQGKAEQLGGKIKQGVGDAMDNLEGDHSHDHNHDHNH